MAAQNKTIHMASSPDPKTYNNVGPRGEMPMITWRNWGCFDVGATASAVAHFGCDGPTTGGAAAGPRLFPPAAARTDCAVVALERIRIADIARVPQDLDAGQQLDVTGRAAGFHHADAFILVGRGVFGPVLLQRVLRRGFVAEAGFFVAPENDGPAPRRLATRTDLELGRTAGPRARVLCSR